MDTAPEDLYCEETTDERGYAYLENQTAGARIQASF